MVAAVQTVLCARLLHEQVQLGEPVPFSVDEGVVHARVRLAPPACRRLVQSLEQRQLVTAVGVRGESAGGLLVEPPGVHTVRCQVQTVTVRAGLYGPGPESCAQPVHVDV